MLLSLKVLVAAAHTLPRGDVLRSDQEASVARVWSIADIPAD